MRDQGLDKRFARICDLAAAVCATARFFASDMMFMARSSETEMAARGGQIYYTSGKNDATLAFVV